MNPANYTHLTNFDSCTGGLGCLLKNINDIGNGYPFLTIFFLTYVILTIGMIKKGNHTLKSFTASTFTMLIIAIISYPFGVLAERLLLMLIVGLAIMSASLVYLMRK
jgi:hypothetical protein